MRTRNLLGIGSLLAALLSGCGGGGGDGGSIGQPPNPGGPNEGVGWIQITRPTTAGAFETDQSMVAMEGTSFIPVGYFCLPTLIPYYDLPPAGYDVRWSNSSTNTNQWVFSRISCFLGLSIVHWETLVPLEMGENSITFTATDGAGNAGRSTIAVSRVSDTAPPTVVSVSPVNGATGVGVNASVTITFNEEMDKTTVNATTVTLRDGANNPVAAAVTYHSFSLDATLTPVNRLAFNTSYQATVTTGVRDASGGNTLAVPYVTSFTTAPNPDVSPPNVQSVSPPSGSICASTMGTVTATFSEDIDPSTVTSGAFFLARTGSELISGMVSYANRTAAFKPDAPLAAGNQYTATVTPIIKDLAGNALASPYSWNFATVAQGVGSWGATSLTGVPEGRDSHVAVWTGSEMIIAGGAPTQAGRYNPATNTWVSAGEAPISLSGAKAVWTGTRMLAWGRSRGMAFDPRTNAWNSIATTNQPAARIDHTAVWTGSEMIVWGGRNGFGSEIVFGNGARYNPENDTWVPVSAVGAPSARYGHTAVWTGSEMIVWGGSFTGDGARYNPSTDTWTPIAATGAPSGRMGHVAVWTGTEMIVWGAYYGGTNSGGRYNPVTDTWRTTDSQCAPSGRWRAPAVWTGTRMIVWGGAEVNTYFADGAVYDPEANTWQLIAITGAPAARADHTAVWTGSEMIIWGGIGGTSGTRLNSGGRFTP